MTCEKRKFARKPCCQSPALFSPNLANWHPEASNLAVFDGWFSGQPMFELQSDCTWGCRLFVPANPRLSKLRAHVHLHVVPRKPGDLEDNDQVATIACKTFCWLSEYLEGLCRLGRVEAISCRLLFGKEFSKHWHLVSCQGAMQLQPPPIARS